jgi:hypothetical protein
MSRADTPVAKGHAAQLSRVLGILDAIDVDGNAAVVVADVREACQARAERIPYAVEPHDIVSVDAAEWRSLATFCDQLATRGLIDERARARQLADIAAAQLTEEEK